MSEDVKAPVPSACPHCGRNHYGQDWCAERTPASGSPDVVERVARAICGRDLEGRDCETACLAANRCVGNLSKSIIEDARAAIEALGTESMMRREDAMEAALTEVFAVTDLYRDIFGSECLGRLDAARAALEGAPVKEGT